MFCGLVIAWRLAGAPTRRSPAAVKATTDGVVRDPHVYAAGVRGADALVSEQATAKGATKKPTAEVRSQLVQVAMDGSAETIAENSVMS